MIGPEDHKPGHRIGIALKDGHKLYYDIDADGRVYWLKPRKNNRLERRRVLDAQLAERIREMAAEHAKEQADEKV